MCHFLPRRYRNTTWTPLKSALMTCVTTAPPWATWSTTATPCRPHLVQNDVQLRLEARVEQHAPQVHSRAKSQIQKVEHPVRRAECDLFALAQATHLRAPEYSAVHTAVLDLARQQRLRVYVHVPGQRRERLSCRCLSTTPIVSRTLITFGRIAAGFTNPACSMSAMIYAGKPASSNVATRARCQRRPRSAHCKLISTNQPGMQCTQQAGTYFSDVL